VWGAVYTVRDAVDYGCNSVNSYATRSPLSNRLVILFMSSHSTCKAP
jgi:hypothetical protein